MRFAVVVKSALIFAFGAAAAFSANPVEDHVNRMQDGLKAKRESLIQAIAELEVSLQAHGIVSKEVPEARATLDAMLKASAWRDLPSRTTKTRESARAALENYIATANKQLEAPRQQLLLIKKAEFEVWARANPEAARLLEIEKRAAKAESAAADAAYAARNAQAAALDAQEQAEDADRRARNAQDESQRSKEILRRNGLDSR